MPRSLKRVAEVDTFDFGKTVTEAISYAKGISKEVNKLIDEIEFLQSRKKQEEQSLERIINEKTEVLKLKQTLTDKIIEKKSEFLEFVGTKQREIEAKEADLAIKEADLAVRTQENDKDINIKQNELKIRSNELEKEKANLRETIKQELKAEFDKLATSNADNIKQTEALVEASKKIKRDTDALARQQEILDVNEALVSDKLQKIADKERELSVRENKIKEEEQKIANTRKGITQAVADIENQISVIKSERNKNASDKKGIEDMRIALNKRNQELDNREIHIGDREATAQTH